jgi:tRNA dimethylallyltransferase
MDAIVILGPTAVGKSHLGVELALELGGEILSIDSRQAYRHIDIGTAKPGLEERRRVPHHLLDMFELDERINARLFAGRFEDAFDDVVSRTKIPILVGGSGLYFRGIFKGFFHVELDETERAGFAKSVENEPPAELHRRLREVDPESADRIHRNDRYRIVRALEVAELSGVPLSEHFKRQEDEQPLTDIEFLKIGLNLPREELYARIDARTERMLEGGWIEEVEKLLRGGADPQWPGLQTLGYPEVVSYLRGGMTREEMQESIARQTRQYAKRQLTWFRREPGVTWLESGIEGAKSAVLGIIT